MSKLIRGFSFRLVDHTHHRNLSVAAGHHGNPSPGNVRFNLLVRIHAPFFRNANGWAEKDRICQEISRRVHFEGRGVFVQRDGTWVVIGPKTIRRIVRRALKVLCEDPQVIAEAEHMRVSIDPFHVVALFQLLTLFRHETEGFRHVLVADRLLAGARFYLDGLLTVIAGQAVTQLTRDTLS